MFAHAEVWVGPTIRVILGIAVAWGYSKSFSQPRLFSGVNTAFVSCALTFIYLDPLFLSVGLELAKVAPFVLAIVAGCVGMSLGILIPVPCPGACLGAAVALLLCSFGIPNFSILVGVLTLLGAVVSQVSSRSSAVSGPISILCSVLIGGAVASCLAYPSLFPYLMDVGLGHSHSVSGGVPSGEAVEIKHMYAIVWLIGAGLTFVFCCLSNGKAILELLLFGGARGAMASPGSQPTAAQSQPKAANSIFNGDQPGAGAGSLDAFNMFDPADLPPRLAEYANMVYSACEDLGNFFGFQDSSVRNQAEHLLILLSNHRRYMTVLPLTIQPPSPIHALHAKVFSNYMKWCKNMGVPPNFSKMNPMCVSGPPAAVSRVVDLVLFFCVWGEAANIRHMPECLWFLYHKMMASYIKYEGFTQMRSLYAGHFLDNVVTPIWKIVQKNMSSKEDHQNKRNYDDFNEFFWSRNCLLYRYSAAPEDSGPDVESSSGVNAPPPGEILPAITDALTAAPKTFLEKRSWIRGILAMYRIIEWHIITFYLLGVVAFSTELIWGLVYSVQVASGVFWVLNALHLQWGLLEVWCAYPGIHLTSTAVCGSIFTLVARFLILVYQTLYLMYTFGPQQGNYFDIPDADANFWWWQYIWLSLLCMIPWFCEALLQLYPAMTTRVFTSQNDYMQSFLNILFPISRLYVGKEVHESFKHTVVYVFFWLTLIAWKLYFSYIFEVYAMVLPTLELTDDYLNFPDQSFAKMFTLLVLRWAPQFLVYIIDMSIWYAAWQAFAGTAEGFAEHLGDVRDMADIRENFVRAPEHFCHKMLSPDAGSRRGSSASFLDTSASGNNIANNTGESASLLGSDPHKLQSYVNRLLDVRIQKWVMFSAVWNEVIDHFRIEDIISNRERDYLKFSRFDGFSQAIYLPVFQTAGVIESALSELERPSEEGFSTDEELFKPILEHVTMRTAVSEVWELGSFLLIKLLGVVHRDDMVTVTNTILKWTENGSLSNHIKMEKMRSVMSQFVGVVTILEKGLSRRKPSAKPKSIANKKRSVHVAKVAGASMGKRSFSATSLSALDNDLKSPDLGSSPEGQGLTIQKKKVHEVFILDALRDQVRDKVRAMAHSFKSLVQDAGSNPESRDVVDRITFLLSMENGFLWDDAYASDQLDDMARNSMFGQVLTKVHGLTVCYPDDVEPKSKEARRRLTFFVNSLFMDMPDAPSIHDMFSWNVMTPFYSEDVLYNKNDLEKRTDALGVSTLLYLQTLYKNDWVNFLERLGITDEEKVWSKKVMNETRIWASIRAQTLTRTVSGMMYFEKALRLLANLERLDDETTNDLMGEKFGYIVACQVYGNMKKNQDSKADDIDQLMHRYPHMRVAYIDTVRLNRGGATVVYSVLVKSDGHGSIQEVYRVRLPGNPVMGEGKPENQNHAVIFSRGEFLQTIDMNQEGYFEEALKMRNALQEFAKREGPLPTTILGLREHIFTGSVSSLANYMALQEMSFVTLGQRVLTNPLCIRLHYGHPDVFDKLFFMTRGGISKSSKGINLSEDIFAGYNNVIRGGQVAFKEYLQVGKGRDVGMSQIYKFEAKLSQGAAEQTLSRDVYRVSHRLDFFRLLSLYYGGIGHYFSNVLTVLTVYVVVYLMVILALFDLEIIGERSVTPMGTIQMMLGGLGLLQTIPLFATLGVERGWWSAAKEIFHVFVTGGPLHFMFHIQTKATFMAQTILVGGAKYRPTGRGFVTQHTPFDEQFRFFASSHLYLGMEVAAALVIMGVFTEVGQYAGRTWSLWLAAGSFLASPFWFNPLTFDWSVVTSDYDKWLRWIRGSSGGAARSWNIWWVEENSHFKTLRFSSKMFYVVKSIIYLVIAEGIRRSNLWHKDTTIGTPFLSVMKTVFFVLGLLVLSAIFRESKNRFTYPVRRTIGIVISLCLTAGIVTIFVEDTDFIRYTLAAYYGIGALCQLGLLVGFKPVKHFYLVHDIICAQIIFFFLFVMGALKLPNSIQTWLLYHNALSSDVVVGDILRYARRNQEAEGGSDQNDELVDQVSELRKLVQKQEEMLVGAGITESSTVVRNASTDAIASLINPSTANPNIQPSRRTPQRHMSMTGIDVWGDMALGDGVESHMTSGEQVGQQSYQGAKQPIQTAPATSQGFQFSQPDTMPPR